MFTDYYSLLSIHTVASIDEIKKAYKEQAVKWHPDRNPGKNTTERMQMINEAYLILKDTEARQRYDREYALFRKYQQSQSQKAHSEKTAEEERKRREAYQREHEAKTAEEARRQQEENVRQGQARAAEEEYKRKQEEAKRKDEEMAEAERKRSSVPEPEYVYSDYQVKDDVLSKWMRNAKNQAVDLAKQTLKDIEGVSGAAAQGCVTGIGQVAALFIIGNLLLLLFKACNSQ